MITRFLSLNTVQEITQTLWHLDLWFLYLTGLLNLVYSPTKYHQYMYITNDIGVMVITMFLLPNTVKEMTQILWHLELWFLYVIRLLNLVYSPTKYHQSQMVLELCNCTVSITQYC